MSRNRITTLIVGAGHPLAELMSELESQFSPPELPLLGVIDLDPEAKAAAGQNPGSDRISVLGHTLEDLSGDVAPELVVLAGCDEATRTALGRRLPDSLQLEHRSAPLLAIVTRLADENRALRADSRRLKEARLRLRQFVETAPLSIYIKDTDLRYRHLNQHALLLFGFDEESVVGKTDHTLFPSGNVRWLQNVEQETLRSGQTHYATGILPVRERETHVHVTLFPIVENQKIEGLYGLVEDTTDLFVSEQKLQQVDGQLDETQKYLREVLENSKDMIFLTDPQGRILTFNSGAENALGYPRDEVVGRPAHELCSTPGAFDKLFEEAILDGHATRYEAEFLDRNGDSIICNISLTKIDDHQGMPLEVVCLCRDITTRLRLKNDLIRSERLAAVGQMASGVAHEINNPLAVIDTIAGLVEETLAADAPQLAPETRDILMKSMNRLHYQVKRCTSITHSLLGFVRNTKTGMVKVDLEALLDECLNVLGIEIRRSRAEIVRMFSTELPTFISDPMLLQQVFVNLIKNALDAIAEVPDRAGVIEITTSGNGDHLTVTIQDNGVGIAKQEQEKVFDLFHTTKPAGRGTGLGLSIVHDILYRLGGSVRLVSEEGQWSRFVIELPMKPPETPLPDPTSMTF